MRRLVLAALVVCSLAFAATGAHAGDDSTFLGGCSVAAVTDVVAGQSQMTGEIDVEALVYSPTAASNPVWATFTCSVKVNGVPQPGAAVTASGAVAVVGGGLITYVADDWDHIQLCQRVDYTGPGDATPTSDTCVDLTTFEFPPTCTWGCGVDVDTVVCLVTPAVPDVPGLLDTNEQGDVYLAGEPFWDCPPYDVIWP